MKELSDTIQNAGSDVALINTLIEEVKKATAKVMYLCTVCVIKSSCIIMVVQCKNNHNAINLQA